MKFFKGIGIILCVVLTSMFFFPFEFRVLPEGMNTKKLMAAAALVLLLWKLIQKQELKADKSFLYITILAGLVSFCGIFSVTYNSTEDYAYATYITSCWVWWGAAYTACTFIKWIHGRLNLQLIADYLAAVCVFQCILALVMDSNKAVKTAVNAIVLQDDQNMVFLGNVHRLYGIGAALDVAGSRFAAVFVMLVFILANSRFVKRWYDYMLYLAAMIVIMVAGNMIARTTMVGVVIGFLYLLYVTFRQDSHAAHHTFVLWRWFAGLVVVCVPLLIYSYNNDPRMQKNMRFGFEGFFNYFEKGDFRYSSNETLKGMYVWPDNAKTWIIGDGYFDNPHGNDPHYTGEITEGFYKNTDVGYLRFIYYFGLVGLVAFSFYFIEVGRICMDRFPRWKGLFLMLLLLHFSVWAKVSTDIFLCFAPFLCIDNEDYAYRLPDSRNV